MSPITISHTELIENVLEDWLVEEIDQEHIKYDVTYYTVIFQKDDKFYQLSYMCSYNHGIDSDDAPYEAHEVEKKEVVTTQWSIIK